MDIYVCTQNESKIRAVKEIFPTAKIHIKNSQSGVSSKPCNLDVLKGAYNRVASICQKNGLIISIEGGHFKINGKYYISDVCCVKDSNGYRFGFGNFYEISKNMYTCIKHNISLNNLIKEITLPKLYTQNSSGLFRQNLSVINFLTNGKMTRKVGNMKALKDALSQKYVQNYQLTYRPKFHLLSLSENENFKKLDEICVKTLAKNK